jgi:hypothetical protein
LINIGFFITNTHLYIENSLPLGYAIDSTAAQKSAGLTARAQPERHVPLETSSAGASSGMLRIFGHLVPVPAVVIGL